MTLTVERGLKLRLRPAGVARKLTLSKGDRCQSSFGHSGKRRRLCAKIVLQGRQGWVRKYRQDEPDDGRRIWGCSGTILGRGEIHASFEFVVVSEQACGQLCEGPVQQVRADEMHSHDCPKIEQERIKEVEKLLEQSGVRLDGQGKLGCWTGGMVVLVDTSKPIKEWVPLAERAL